MEQNIPCGIAGVGTPGISNGQGLVTNLEIATVGFRFAASKNFIQIKFATANAEALNRTGDGDCSFVTSGHNARRGTH